MQSTDYASTTVPLEPTPSEHWRRYALKAGRVAAMLPVAVGLVVIVAVIVASDGRSPFMAVLLGIGVGLLSLHSSFHRVVYRRLMDIRVPYADNAKSVTPSARYERMMLGLEVENVLRFHLAPDDFPPPTLVDTLLPTFDVEKVRSDEGMMALLRAYIALKSRQIDTYNAREFLGRRPLTERTCRFLRSDLQYRLKSDPWAAAPPWMPLPLSHDELRSHAVWPFASLSEYEDACGVVRQDSVEEMIRQRMELDTELVERATMVGEADATDATVRVCALDMADARDTDRNIPDDGPDWPQELLDDIARRQVGGTE